MSTGEALKRENAQQRSRPADMSRKEPNIKMKTSNTSNTARFLFVAPISLLLGPIQAWAQVLGVFCTGVDNTGAALPNLAVDPHYSLISSADPAFPGPDAMVIDDTTFPIATGNWEANSGISKWIGPQGAQDYLADPVNGDPTGNYTYRLTFDLTSYVSDLVQLVGRWTCDSEGEILLNGVPTGTSVSTNDWWPNLPATWHPVLLSAGFLPGTNTVDFVVARVPFYSSPNLPTGLRVQLALSNSPPPQLEITPVGSLALIWWPTNVPSFRLETCPGFAGAQNWSPFMGKVTVVGDQNVAETDMMGAASFFRLHKP